MHGITHISLDFWNTLGHPNPQYEKYRNITIAAAFNTSPDRAAVAYRNVKNRMEEQAIRTGRVQNPDEIRLEFNRELNRLVQPEQFHTLMHRLRELFQLNPPVISSETVKCLRQLEKAGYTLNIASNTNFIIPGGALQVLLSPVFSFYLWSDKLGVCKPNPEFFSLIAQRADVPPHRILHVGDSYQCDNVPAMAAGMSTMQCGPQLPVEKILQNFIPETADAA